MPSHDRLRKKIVSQKTPRIALYKHVLNTPNSVFVYCEKKTEERSKIWCQSLKSTSSEGEKTFPDA